MIQNPIAEARRLCFDTNALIYLLERIEPYHSWLHPVFKSVELGEREAVFSAVTETEVMVRPIRDRNAVLLGAIDLALAAQNATVVEVTRTVARLAASVRANLNLTLADALIVATAVASDCDAIVGNDRACAQRVTEIPYIYLDDAVSR